MPDTPATPPRTLADTLVETWAAQARDGFLLTDPGSADVSVREVLDPACDVTYRFQWMPHREIRGNVAELERRGILNPERDKRRLFRDARDPQGQHCFLCAENVAECHPMEKLVPMELAGRKYFAGANFAWIGSDHFTVMSAEHVDQVYSRHVLEAMLDLHVQTADRFRVLFNGPGAGASIPWHMHFQITTAPMPIERLQPGREHCYPTAVRRFRANDGGLEAAHALAEHWLGGDPRQHSVNLLIATIGVDPCVFVFPRDQRYASAPGKGLIGGFEVSGDFVLSAPREEETFHEASVDIARDLLRQIRPPDWPPDSAP